MPPVHDEIRDMWRVKGGKEEGTEDCWLHGAGGIIDAIRKQVRTINLPSLTKN